jgi:hypothetical protein
LFHFVFQTTNETVRISDPSTHLKKKKKNNQKNHAEMPGFKNYYFKSSTAAFFLKFSFSSVKKRTLGTTALTLPGISAAFDALERQERVLDQEIRDLGQRCHSPAKIP